jgi:hypothetical protein
MLKKTANKEGKALFFKQQKMIAATAESFLKQIASFPLQEEDEKERKSYLEFLAVHSPSLETVGAERRMHQKIKNFLEKLLTNYAASPNSKEESKPNQTPKNHETNSQELLRKNMQIQPDVARSQLLQMEEEDRTKKGVSQKFEVKRPW